MKRLVVIVMAALGVVMFGICFAKSTPASNSTDSGTKVTCTMGQNIHCQLMHVRTGYSGRVLYRIWVKATENAGIGIYVNNVATHEQQIMDENLTNYGDPSPIKLDMDFDWQPTATFSSRKVANDFTCGVCDKSILGRCLTARTVSCKGNVVITQQGVTGYEPATTSRGYGSNTALM